MSSLTSIGTVAPSKQDVRTPKALIEAIEKRFGFLMFDLAATHENKVADRCYTKADNSLRSQTSWLKAGEYCYQRGGRAFLNPPFADVAPWVRKAAETVVVVKHCGPLVLLPACVCTSWFNTNVRNFARVYELFPRPFKEIRDCILADFADEPGRELWEWKL